MQGVGDEARDSLPEDGELKSGSGRTEAGAAMPAGTQHPPSASPRRTSAGAAGGCRYHRGCQRVVFVESFGQGAASADISRAAGRAESSAVSGQEGIE